MDSNAIFLTWDTLPLEIVDMIFSHLLLPLVGVLMKSENFTLAFVARRRYYSNIELNFCDSLGSSVHRMDDNSLHMEPSEFEALASSDLLDQLRIEKLSIYVQKEIKDYRFPHEEALNKISSIVTDVSLTFAIYGYNSMFDWACLPSSPLVQRCIQEISVQCGPIDPNIPPLPNLRKLDIKGDYSYTTNIDTLPVRFPLNLQEFVLRDSHGLLSVFANLPSTLQRFEIVKARYFSIDDFIKLKLPNLKYLLLREILSMTEINELFDLPSLLENLELWWIDPYWELDQPWELDFDSFERRQLPLALQKLSITNCPLNKFRVDIFPDCFKELIINTTELTSSEIRMLEFPPSLVSLLVAHAYLSSLDFVNSLPGSLKSLNLSKNDFGFLKETDEDADTARSYQINFPESLQKLNLEENGGLFTLYSLENFIFPLSLTDLNLSGTNFRSIKKLNLPLLQILNLLSNNLISVEELDIPPSLTYLNLSRNKLQKFSKTLPDSVEFMSLEHNQLSELMDFHIPVNCTELTLSHNPLHRIQFTNADNPGLKLQDLNLDKISVTTLSDISPLPQYLTRLTISGPGVSSLSGIQLPVGLNHLKATYSKITSLENVEFPPHLETLDLQYNQISSLANVHFPKNLLSLELDDNRITSIDAIQLPLKLKLLNLRKNAISAINELQLPDSLERLYLNNQEHEHLLNLLAGLTKLPSKLHILDLCHNGLSEQAIQHLDFPASLKRLHVHNNKFENYRKWWIETELTCPWISYFESHMCRSHYDRYH
ncbi:hypothetical protein BABINDRAFT_162375 [Babjeviella inositovora NRRL Y-12698]|uniref:Uncharacterized protein n=1 Tax=Babjeviella inositovora NRRL Y-12698 TaxID=984486 RepID=A0A1E3QNK8_9ASCO|nr:uncharacterized protein BABINDRAFT_162375 [Babjeviella inositovora NRRL Y-12698]ODQ78672.1 hypothetical protein BABINDRAFT_162375 [Babjeviella inositovora NRRL Y-12698]